MAGQVNIGGNTASVQLTGNDAITADQEIGFPDTNGESAVVIVTPTSQDIETTGDIECGNLDATGNITAIGRIANGNVSPDPDSNEGGNILYAGAGGLRSFRSAPADSPSTGIDLYNNGAEVFGALTNGSVRAVGNGTFGVEGVPSSDEGNVELYGDVGRLQINGRVPEAGEGTSYFLNFYNNNSEKLSVSKGGDVTAAGTLTTGTYQTNNGRINLRPGSASDTSLQIASGNPFEDIYTLTNEGTVYANSNGDATRDPKYTLNATNGNITAAGTITPGALVFNLEEDNPDAYKVVGTVDEVEEITNSSGEVEYVVTKTEEIKEYCGETLDVRETLLSLLERATAQDAVIAELTRQITELKGGSN